LFPTPIQGHAVGLDRETELNTESQQFIQESIRTMKSLLTSVNGTQPLENLSRQQVAEMIQNWRVGRLSNFNSPDGINSDICTV